MPGTILSFCIRSSYLVFMHKTKNVQNHLSFSSSHINRKGERNHLACQKVKSFTKHGKDHNIIPTPFLNCSRICDLRTPYNVIFFWIGMSLCYAIYYVVCVRFVYIHVYYQYDCVTHKFWYFSDEAQNKQKKTKKKKNGSYGNRSTSWKKYIYQNFCYIAVIYI